MKISRKHDVCRVEWRPRAGLVILPPPTHRKMSCPRGYRYVVKQGRDICSK